MRAKRNKASTIIDQTNKKLLRQATGDKLRQQVTLPKEQSKKNIN